MDKQYENDRFEFENRCDKVRKHAFTVSSHRVVDLKVNNLTKTKRLGRISTRIKKVRAQLKALNRRIYVLYAKDTDYLFNHFKSNTILHDWKEWNLLQRAMELIEEYSCLLLLMEDSCDWENTGDFLAEDPMVNTHCFVFEGLWDSDRETLTLHRKEILHPTQPAPLPTDNRKSLSVGCPLSIEKLTTIINWMNETYHLLDPRTSVECFIRKIINPNWANDDEPVYLAGQTNVFSCMIKCIKRQYKHFNYAHIGRSGLFFSKKGIVLNESNLSSGNLKDVEKKQSIEAKFT